MNDMDNELRDAFGQDGDYDPNAGQQSAAAVVEAFDGRLRKVERITWAYLSVASMLMVFAVERFIVVTSTKSVVGYGLLGLVAFEATILMKLWYWVVNNKLSVLRELKILRVERTISLSCGEDSRPFNQEGS